MKCLIAFSACLRFYFSGEGSGKEAEVEEKSDGNKTVFLVVGIVGGVLLVAIIAGAIAGTIICRRQAAMKRDQEEIAAFSNGPKPSVNIESKYGSTGA